METANNTDTQANIARKDSLKHILPSKESSSSKVKILKPKVTRITEMTEEALNPNDKKKS